MTIVHIRPRMQSRAMIVRSCAMIVRSCAMIVRSCTILVHTAAPWHSVILRLLRGPSSFEGSIFSYRRRFKIVVIGKSLLRALRGFGWLLGLLDSFRRLGI